MALTEAQKRAKANYAKKSTKNINLTFYPSDMDLYEFMQTRPNKAGFIKDLIRQAMEQEQERDV